jgi:flagellar motor protein MotB
MAIMRRRRTTEHQEVDTEGSWAISYGDMITLLLTFFILFFSTDPHRDRVTSMEASLLSRFTEAAAPPSAGPRGQDPQFDQLMRDRLSAEVHKLGQKLIIEFPDVSFFDLGRIEVTSKGRSELKKFTGLYMPYAGNFILSIRAFTDHKKVLKFKNRPFKDNLELSALRSVAAMRVLQHLGIPLHRMRLAGFGELRLDGEELSRAIASTPAHGRDGMAMARKVVLVIEPEPKESL